ncbi:hypothetical protein GE061_010618 [Apolygus lucorum]|uniref:Kinesin motor domain-containing protein n=1 Tax=Apolygus lucorum TaxID=248454 RepID=A0A8S9XXA7_APOLU|nr:hypothetical protein GE061_010618 [Apolygus lucorum]
MRLIDCISNNYELSELSYFLICFWTLLYISEFETNFQPERLGNWQVPKKYPHERPRARRGHTKVIADDRGHLLPGVTRIEPWNHFTSTWQLPKRITRKVARDVNTLRPTRKHLTSWEKRSYHVPIYDRNNPPALPSTMASAISKYNVFLRIKPLDVLNIDDQLNADILTDIEPSSITLSHTNKKNEIIKCQYNFEKVFKPSASQSEVFDEVISPKLNDFFKGNDSLVFSYGTSNSGKSFTMQGTRDQPGIIPRVVHVIYQSIHGHIDTELKLKPYKSCQAAIVNERERKELIAEKSEIFERLHSSLTESHDTSLSGMTSEQATLSMDLEDSPGIPNCLKDDEMCSVWISFYEVYNEQIFDLLAFNPTSLQNPLRLEFDEEDDSFHPKDLKVINASTWEEAFDLYRYGKRNLRVSETILNRKSSRSHSVFTLRILTRKVDETDQYLGVNCFNLCDLAGSERLKHTSQMGKATVKETLNINTSILTLNKCFASLKADTQKVIRGSEHGTVLPYRDSKLTMLFKKFLKGQGQLTMVANMSQESHMFYQTEQILKITSLAYKTRVDKKTNDNLAFRLPLVMPKRRFSTMMAQEQSSPVSTRNVNPIAGSRLYPGAAADSINPEILRLRKENFKLVEEMKRRDLERQQLDTEAKELERSLKSRIYELETQLNTQSRNLENRNVYQEKFFELEKKYRTRVTEANLKELDFFRRLDAAEAKVDELTSALQDAFNIEDSAGPKETVTKVIYLHNNLFAAAKEEVDELSNLNEDLTQKVVTLQNLISERDNEISNLKGQILDAELLRQREEVRLNNLKPPEGTEVENEVTSCDNSDDEFLSSNTKVKSHGGARWISDEESSPLYIPPKAKTTAKKKKTVRNKDFPYHRSCRKAKGSESPETSHEILPARRARRQLMRPVEDFLGDNLQSEQETPPQLSPGAFMKNTLRSGRRRKIRFHYPEKWRGRHAGVRRWSDAMG